LYQQADRRALHLEMASLTGQRMTSLLDLNSLLAEVVRLIRDKFGYYHTHIFVLDEQAGEVVLKEACGTFAALIKARGVRLKIGQEGITGWVAYTGQTLVCNDVSHEPRYVAAELVPETQSELAVPLRVGNRIVGVLDVQSDRRDAFDKEDVTVMQILGNQVGIAIRNAQLFQETRHRYEAMIALHEISLDMIAQLDTTQLLQALLRRGAQLLGAQAGSLFLYDPEREMIYNAANYNTWQDWTGVILRLGEGVVGRVIQSGKPLIENDYGNWSGRAEVFSGSPQTRVVSAPLKWQNRIIGGINVINDVHGRSFQENDLWLLTHFADLASIAVKNAELHTQVKEFSQDLEWKVEQRTEELSRARDDIILKAEQLRSLLAKTIDIQEQERARIARDMHDGVVQLISAARFELQAAKTYSRPAFAPTAEEKLETTHQILEEMEKEIRRTIYNLHPPILDAVGLAPALRKYASSFQELSGIACEMEVEGMPYRLTAATEIAVFRVVQEALQNVAAHANAERAHVSVNYEPEMLAIRIHDDGTGFDYDRWMQGHYSNHLGLFGMRERITSLGGTMDVHSGNGNGTELVFELPVVQDEGPL
ncbi:MAG TPA: GAF domain-containing sensor histidine kinase, partial [Anaerolineae bacterium]